MLTGIIVPVQRFPQFHWKEIVKLYKSVWISVPLFVLLGSCTFSPNDGNQPSACAEYAQTLEQVNADDRAHTDWLSGNKGFLGVYGYSSEFPALDKMESTIREKLLDAHGFEMIEGTTDDIPDDGCSKYQTDARLYAEQYNLKKLELNSANGPNP